jgi:DNA-binding Lrp family transcriptional regulator
MKLDTLDRQIIQATQTGFPLNSKPYHTIAEQLNVSPQEIMLRFQKMLESGIIRRIGAIPNHYKLGFTANGMSVWNVPDEVVDEYGRKIGELAFVSHCYRRPRHLPIWHFNLFAMVHGKSKPEVEEKVEQIAQLLGEYNLDHQILYSTKILKKTGFRLVD